MHQMDLGFTELQAYMESYEQRCSLLIAHYFNNKPRLFRCDSLQVITIDDPGYFTAVGTGDAVELALYLLKQYGQPDMSFTAALAVMIYVIEEVKNRETHCGGPAVIGCVRNPNSGDYTGGKPGLFDQSFIDHIAAEFSEYNKTTRLQWNKQIAEKLDELGRKWSEKLNPPVNCASSPEGG